MPRQIVPPYKPQDDLEEAPLLCPTGSSGAESLPLHVSDHINLTSHMLAGGSHMLDHHRNTNSISGKVRWQGDVPPSSVGIANDHEYHEISDEETLVK